MAGPFRAFPATARCSPASCRRPSATGCRSAIADRGIDYVGQELVRLSTTPVWEQGRITPRPFVLRVFAAATPQRLDHHARRLLPDCRAARCPRRLDGRRRAVGGCLGGLRQGGFGFDAAAGGRRRAHPAHRRRGPEPRRRQSVLARPLSRARRGDAAADPRARHADARSRQGIVDRAALGRAHPAAAGDLGRDLAGDAGATPRRSSPRRCRARKNSARRCRW